MGNIAPRRFCCWTKIFWTTLWYTQTFHISPYRITNLLQWNAVLTNWLSTMQNRIAVETIFHENKFCISIDDRIQYVIYANNLISMELSYGNNEQSFHIFGLHSKIIVCECLSIVCQMFMQHINIEPHQWKWCRDFNPCFIVRCRYTQIRCFQI